MTHIRRLIGTHLAVCGEPAPASSISYEHFVERKTQPAIAGQIERIPGGVCVACRRMLEELGV